MANEQAVDRVRLELESRRNSILAQAAAVALVGLTIMLTGAPGFVENWFSPWSRYLLGLLAFAPGVTASVGVSMDGRRSALVQILGLTGMAAWYAAMMLMYAVLTFEDAKWIVGFGEPLPDGASGRNYVPLLYLGLFLSTMIPLWTTLKVVRQRRPSSSSTS